MKKSTRVIGMEKEDIACKYLIKNGYKIVERNFHGGRFAEVDIIARSDDGYLCFVEVKYRTDDKHGGYVGSVDTQKIKNICLGAKYYISRHKLSDDTPIRFDVVFILGEDISLVKNAFDFIS